MHIFLSFIFSAVLHYIGHSFIACSTTIHKLWIPVHLVFPLGLKAAGCVGFGGLFLAKDSFFSSATLVFTGFTGLLFALIFDRLIF